MSGPDVVMAAIFGGGLFALAALPAGAALDLRGPARVAALGAAAALALPGVALLWASVAVGVAWLLEAL